MLMVLMWLVIILFSLILIFFHLPRRLFTGILKQLFIWFYRVELEGFEHYRNIKDDEPLVIVANHSSFLDGALIGVFLPEKLTFAVASEFVNAWWAKPFLKYINTYSIDLSNPLVTKDIIEITRKGAKCVIFPEGRITVTGSLMKIYEGPGMVADKAQAKILPIRITGAQYSTFSRLKGKVRTRRFPKITITILPPQDFTIPSEYKGRKRREIISLKLYELMTNMMFSSSKADGTLFQALIDASKIHGPQHLVLEDIKQQPMSYRKLLTASFFLANKIAKLAVNQKNVALLLPNSNALLAAFFGLQAIDRVPALLNYSMGEDHVLTMCRMAVIKTVITSQAFINQGKLTALVDKLQLVGIEICYLEKLEKTGKFKALCAGFFPEFYYHKLIHANEQKLEQMAAQPAVILFTSGSEAKPKAVVLSHHNLLSNCRQMASVIDFSSSDKVFNPLPIFHSFGLTTATLLPLFNGVKIFLYPTPLHYRMIPEFVYSVNATILFGTDTFLTGYAALAHPYDFYSLRYVFVGGERLRESTRKTWSEEFGVRILAGYGTTETSPVLSCNTPMNHKVGTVGKFLPAINYRLEQIPGIEEGGKLIVSGPNVMLGYYTEQAPGELRPLANGEYDTGDVVNIDEQGFITILGRVKRFAKIAGEMVSLTAVESYVHDLWPDYQHAVIAVDDEKKGQRIVLLTNYSEASREALIHYYHSRHITELYLPRNLFYEKELPTLANGKIDYARVIEVIHNNLL